MDFVSSIFGILLGSMFDYHTYVGIVLGALFTPFWAFLYTWCKDKVVSKSPLAGVVVQGIESSVKTVEGEINPPTKMVEDKLKKKK